MLGVDPADHRARIHGQVPSRSLPVASLSVGRTGDGAQRPAGRLGPPAIGHLGPPGSVDDGIADAALRPVDHDHGPDDAVVDRHRGEGMQHDDAGPADGLRFARRSATQTGDEGAVADDQMSGCGIVGLVDHQRGSGEQQPVEHHRGVRLDVEAELIGTRQMRPHPVGGAQGRGPILDGVPLVLGCDRGGKVVATAVDHLHRTAVVHSAQQGRQVLPAGRGDDLAHGLDVG